jgi:glucose-6-phosphate isomerase
MADLWEDAALGFRLDVSRMSIPDAYRVSLEDAMQEAFAAMRALEAGAVANPDEGRMVGHYWLRAPELAPTREIAEAIRSTLHRVLAFAADIHRARRFRHVLLVGIGGSALGPQFVAEALGTQADRLRPHFLDNTDPDGMARTLGALAPELSATLTVVVSKSGGTPETRNGMLETAAAYRARDLVFGEHACAITQEGSALDRTAVEQGFLARFPMWDWVGGRTSELSAVGLLPAALQGIDIRAMLAGAAAMDRATRTAETRRNPAALLALAWHHATGGAGRRDMVVLPYKDRLALFSRYLQQLVMESLGKELDLDGRVVHQGLAVYGNKGSTDQHAYVQQLREGVPNFFVTFVQVLEDGGSGLEVEPGITSGDYLHGLLLGTRRALFEAGRPSILLTLRQVSPASVGALIALYERAVGLYASLIHVNAYHQPGVEGGKRAAASVLALQKEVVAALQRRGASGGTAEQLAADAGSAGDVETVWHILEHLAANPGRGVSRREHDGVVLYAAAR